MTVVRQLLQRLRMWIHDGQSLEDHRDGIIDELAMQADTNQGNIDPRLWIVQDTPSQPCSIGNDLIVGPQAIQDLFTQGTESPPVNCLLIHGLESPSALELLAEARRVTFVLKACRRED